MFSFWFINHILNFRVVAGLWRGFWLGMHRQMWATFDSKGRPTGAWSAAARVVCVKISCTPAHFMCACTCICGLNERKVRIEGEALKIETLNLAYIHSRAEWSGVNGAASLSSHLSVKCLALRSADYTDVSLCDAEEESSSDLRSLPFALTAG